jgi:hypothetical protein
MKVNIGPYVSHWSAYTLVHTLLTKVGVSEERCDAIAERYEDGIISKVVEWFNTKRNRKINVRIDKYDTWGAGETLSLIIAPMLRQLRDTKQGCPLVDNRDVPVELRANKKEETFEQTEAKWNYVLNEMIYSFEALEKNALGIEDWEAKFYSGEVDFISVETEINGKMYHTLERGPNHTFAVDSKNLSKERKRIDNGFRLFGKYYWNLWD